MGELALISFDDNKVKVIKDKYPQLSAPQFELFLAIAKGRGLDPVLNQIHALVHKDRDGNKIMTPIVGIDGFRLIAHRTKEYAGRSEAEFEYGSGKFPDKVKITVYRMTNGVRCEYTATARWDEYFPSQQSKQFQWKKMPETMLEKCCEAKALRMAFPGDLSGLYEAAEMDYTRERDITPETSRDFDATTATLKELGGLLQEKEISYESACSRASQIFNREITELNQFSEHEAKQVIELIGEKNG